MRNRVKTARIRMEAKESMYSKAGCKHAIYGLCYSTALGNIVEELADNVDEVRYFYDEKSFNICVDNIHLRYMDCENLNIYAVHRAE